MRTSRILVLPLIMSMLFLLLSLSAFTYPASTSHNGHRVQPGQELVFSFPLKNDPNAHLHLKLSWVALNTAGAVVPAGVSCTGTGEQEWITNAFGGTLASYQITATFCYNGSQVTSITTPHMRAGQPAVSGASIATTRTQRSI